MINAQAVGLPCDKGTFLHDVIVKHRKERGQDGQCCAFLVLQLPEIVLHLSRKAKDSQLQVAFWVY